MTAIVIDPGIHDLRNKGNNAQLQVAVNRLYRLWPDAAIYVFTDSPHLLKLICPRTFPISPDNRYDWRKRKLLFNTFHQLMPRLILRTVLEIREEARYRKSLSTSTSTSGATSSNPATAAEGISFTKLSDKEQAEGEEQGWNVIREADLFVVSGGGLFTDVAKESALKTVAKIETAMNLGKPVALLGQGVGPVEDPILNNKIKNVFPKVNLICLREKKSGPPIVKALGVRDSNIAFTGDDAIELVYETRTQKGGGGIGVNLRTTSYTAVDQGHLEIIRTVIDGAAAKYKARLYPIEISCSLKEADEKVIQQIFRLKQGPFPHIQRFSSALELIKRVANCRLVVVGAYHAAVFALAQGIPAICLANSKTYFDKFNGLKDLFGPGCQVINISDSHFQESLEREIDLAWSSAEELREPLLKSAREQMECGQVAYQRLWEITRCEG